MSLLYDVVSRIPRGGLIVAAAFAVVVGPFSGVLVGGVWGVIVVLVAVWVVVLAGGLLALRVHVDRLPLEIAGRVAEGRLDGHRAWSFRVRLGAGRRLQQVAAEVRFVTDRGDAIELPLLVAEARDVLGPWTVVAVDRHEQCPDRRGSLRLTVRAVEGSKAWHAERTFLPSDWVVGRFRSVWVSKKGRLSLDAVRWKRIDETP